VIHTSELRQALSDAGLLAGTSGPLPDVVTMLTDDSRAATPGSAFVAVRGRLQDGHRYLPDAGKQGIALAVVEDASATDVPALIVRDARRAVALLGAHVHGYPGQALSIVGVTGTSGKTTTVSILRHLLDTPQTPAASIGTLGVLVGGAGTPLAGGAGLTTPGPLELQRVLRGLVEAGVRRVAMEVSSHALDQHRVDGVAYQAAVFTNLSRDHLDYHEGVEAYLAAKARLVSLLEPGGTLVINGEAPEWAALPPWPRTIRFGFASADVAATDVAYDSSGSRWTLSAGGSSAAVRLPLMGDFNVSNALGAAAAAWALGEPVSVIADRLGTLRQIPGRLERTLDRPVVLRDYAHKPDALERALLALRPFTPGRIIVVFGCGGDRDRGKRPIMGGIAERLADLVIVTSDNPRTEDPERILDEIEAGMTRGRHARIEDRRLAIAHAMGEAREGDVVLLAGKGHETYQIRGTTSLPFDEREIVRELAGVLP
jgi:UDP-N-acetylmuramoyl-L-alanyl-D-glutamate--2,6-diaminopimelate ligase